jgi:hypothetical protein
VAARYPQPSAEVEATLLAAIKTARSCMTRKGMSVSGGPIYPQGSPTSPDGELIVGRASGGAYVAFYTDASRAEQLEPELTQSATRSGGALQRRGAVTVLLIRRPGKKLRSAVLACAFP